MENSVSSMSISDDDSSLKDNMTLEMVNDMLNMYIKKINFNENMNKKLSKKKLEMKISLLRFLKILQNLFFQKYIIVCLIGILIMEI